ncbi:MAG TPA: cysteine rich repeat-containing protein [Rhizomicrobium sp.]|nr:cysteine rich repeat-containing protein [Rhizomicrobium sp.]
MTASLLLATGTTLAATPKGPPGEPSHACRPYMERYCDDVKWGQGRRIACLAKHRGQLNAACRDRLDLMEQVFALTQKNLAEKRKQEAAEKAKQRNQPAGAKKPAQPQ